LYSSFSSGEVGVVVLYVAVTTIALNNAGNT